MEICQLCGDLLYDNEAIKTEDEDIVCEHCYKEFFDYCFYCGKYKRGNLLERIEIDGMLYDICLDCLSGCRNYSN